MIRAGPGAWPTASSWSAASSPSGATGGRITAGRPASTESAWMTAPNSAGSNGWRGPPSTQATEPSASRRSPASAVPPVSTGSTTALPASARLALRAHHHTGAAPRRSKLFAHTRKCRRSNHGSVCGECRHGSPVIDCGVRNRPGSIDKRTTTGRLADHAAWSRSTACSGEASVAASMLTDSASIHRSGTVSVPTTITPRPNAAIGSAGTGRLYAGPVTSDPASTVPRSWLSASC